MRETHAVTTYSGYIVLFDPAAIRLERPDEPDYETLEQGEEAGSLLFWAASEEHVAIQLAVDEDVSEELTARAADEKRAIVTFPSGRLWLTDPAFMHSEREPKSVAEGAGPILISPGTYEGRVFMLSWPPQVHERYLKQVSGRLPVFVRDLLAMVAFLLAAATFIALPVFLIGRALDDGLAGVARTLPFAAAVFIPLWVIVIGIWRLPVLVAVDRADQEFAVQHPDAVIQLMGQELTTP